MGEAKQRKHKDLLQIGRLAMREEGDFWVAYYAQPDTMERAILLGTVQMRFVLDPGRKNAFMDLMRDAVADIIEETSGVRPIWPNKPKPAPEHERTKPA